MKLILIIVAGLALPAIAQATEPHELPTPLPVLTSSPSAAARAGASSTAHSGAHVGDVKTGASTSTSSATNSAGGGTATSAGGSVADHSRSSMWVLPAPVFTPPMAPLSCPQAHIEQSAVALGWNFFSHAQARTDASACTAIIAINSLIDRCQYGRAQRALDLLAARVLPGYEVQPADYPDLTPQHCAALKAPPPSAPPTLSLIPPPAAVAPVAAAQCAAPVARKPPQRKAVAKACK